MCSRLVLYHVSGLFVFAQMFARLFVVMILDISNSYDSKHFPFKMFPEHIFLFQECFLKRRHKHIYWAQCLSQKNVLPEKQCFC